MLIQLKLKPFMLILPLLLGSDAARAAQQFVTLPGAYGAVTVTESGCPTAAPWNPFTAAGRIGLALTTVSTCTLTFSRPVLTSSITIDIDGNNTGDIVSFSLNGVSYTPVPGDLSGTLVPALTTGSLTISGATITGNGSGTLRFTNSPPATITSLSISEIPGGAGTFFRVGFDDAAAAVAVPVLSEWGMVALGVGFLLVFLRISKSAALSA